MKDFRINNKGTGQLFKNKFLERLTRTAFIIPVVFYYLLALICLYVAFQNEEISLLRNIWMIPVGMIAFSFVEYLIHRYLFHFPATTAQQEKVLYSVHGIHHEFPRDKDRLVMPLVVSIFLAFGFFMLFNALIGKNSIIFFAGFIAGYSSYLIIHYAVHAMKPPQNFFKFWWKHHSLHHYASVHSAYSVSFPLWDIIFRTMPPEKDAAMAADKLRDSVSI
jgi:4-hydroxysphinganine ceramide fatty acyl 2-hydroxylase